MGRKESSENSFSSINLQHIDWTYVELYDSSKYNINIPRVNSDQHKKLHHLNIQLIFFAIPILQNYFLFNYWATFWQIELFWLDGFSLHHTELSKRSVFPYPRLKDYVGMNKNQIIWRLKCLVERTNEKKTMSQI